MPVVGAVIFSRSGVSFWPAELLPSDTVFTAEITTGAESAAGVALEESYSWSFTTGDMTGGTLPVNLGMAGTFAILAKSAVSTVPTSAITGDVGISPAAATYLTGFSLKADPTNQFATSLQVTGRLYAANYVPPTPMKLTTAVGRMEIAYTDAASRAATVTGLGAGDIGGQTLATGVYRWGTSLLIPTEVTLEGGATDVWIFQIAGDLTMRSATSVYLTGGALTKGVFWQVAGHVEIGTTAHCAGVILTQTAINLRTKASINGRLLAQTAVDIDESTVTQPAP